MTHSEDRADPVCGLTSGDVARVIGVDLKTIHNWVKLGHLSGRRTLGGHLRFHRVEVVRFMHRFGYRVPEALGVPAPRVVAAGLSLSESRVNGSRVSLRGFKLEICDGLFDAALCIASGEHDLVLIALDEFSMPSIAELIDAVRRRPLTHGLAVIGVGGTAYARDAFIRCGGDAAVRDDSQIRGIVRWAIGAGSLPDQSASQVVLEL